MRSGSLLVCMLSPQIPLLSLRPTLAPLLPSFTQHAVLPMSSHLATCPCTHLLPNPVPLHEFFWPGICLSLTSKPCPLIVWWILIQLQVPGVNPWWILSLKFPSADCFVNSNWIFVTCEQMLELFYSTVIMYFHFFFPLHILIDKWLALARAVEIDSEVGLSGQGRL